MQNTLVSARPSVPAGSHPPASLKARYTALHRDMVCQLERTIAIENHWLLYTLLGWEHLVACGVSHYLVAVAGLQAPHRWPYGVVWLAQILVATGTLCTFRGRRRLDESPLSVIITRVWVIFILLCCDVAALNVTAGLPVFVFLPALATLSSFAFLVLACLVSRRLVLAALALFATGILIARFPAYGFLLYGGGWLLVLQTLGLVFWRRRKRWLPASGTEML